MESCDLNRRNFIEINRSSNFVILSNSISSCLSYWNGGFYGWILNLNSSFSCEGHPSLFCQLIFDFLISVALFDIKLSLHLFLANLHHFILLLDCYTYKFCDNTHHLLIIKCDVILDLFESLFLMIFLSKMLNLGVCALIFGRL